jgi:hypothetical protein
VRKEHGLEAAQVLGHAHAKVSEIYAKKNMDLAAKVAGEMGEEKVSQELPCARRLLVSAIEHASTDVHCGRCDEWHLLSAEPIEHPLHPRTVRIGESGFPTMANRILERFRIRTRQSHSPKLRS